MSDSFDVVVAGSGMGGLTAAALLSARGFRTLVLERQRQVGGYLASFRRGPYRFDAGASFLGAVEAGEEIGDLLDAAGIRDRIRFEAVGHSFRMIVPDQDLVLDTSEGSFTDALAATFPESRPALARLERLFEKTGREIERFTRLDGWWRLLMPILCPRLLRYGRTTLGDRVYPKIDNPTLRALMTNLPATAPPSEVAFLFAATILTKCNAGDLYHPVGGFGAFAERLAEAIEAKDGRVRTGDGLAAIEQDGQRVVAVRTNSGERIESPIVVAGINPDDALAMLDGPPSKAVDAATKRTARFRYSASAFMVYLGLDPAADWSSEYFLTTLFEVTDLEAYYAKIARGEMPERGIIHVVFAGAADSADAAPTAKIITVAPYEYFARVRAESGDEAYQALKNRVADDLVERVTGSIPSLRDRIVLREAASPLTFEHWTGNRNGAMYGVEPVPDEFGPWRWPNVGVLQGLYFCGHYSRPSHGVVGACYSGRFAANCVLRDARGKGA